MHFEFLKKSETRDFEWLEHAEVSKLIKTPKMMIRRMPQNQVFL